MCDSPLVLAAIAFIFDAPEYLFPRNSVTRLFS